MKRGESKGLFDLGQQLIKGLIGTDSKGASEREKEWRVASGWCLGEIWSVYGNNVSNSSFLLSDLVRRKVKLTRIGLLFIFIFILGYEFIC